MDKIAVNVQNISKRYRRYQNPIDRLKELIFPQSVKGDDFWALHNISLSVKQGESLGILGQNGSGKSTLLQIITQTIVPTSGHISVTGRISALLELGSGFNPEFTGRQNVRMNGRILGFSKKEVESKLDEVIDFAEIDDFIDQPVHTYSSGMFVRLAFSAAVVWEPEILIIDEALAVGDIFFQQKCFERIKKLQQQGTTILFVSHDNHTVVNLCNRAAVLHHGKLIFLGEPSVAVEKYHELYYTSHPLDTQKNQKALQDNNKQPDKTQDNISYEGVETITPQVSNLTFIQDFPEKNRYGKHVGLIEGISVSDSEGQLKSSISMDEKLTISIKVGSHPKEITPLNIGFYLKDRLGQMLIGSNTKMLRQDLAGHTSGEPFICQFSLCPKIAPGEYTLDVAVAENKLNATIIYDWINCATVLTIFSKDKSKEQGGLCRPDIKVKTFFDTEV